MDVVVLSSLVHAWIGIVNFKLFLFFLFLLIAAPLKEVVEVFRVYVFTDRIAAYTVIIFIIQPL